MQAAFQLRFLAGVGLAASTVSFSGTQLFGTVGLGALAWFCAIFYTYLYNGCTDSREDRLNGSLRPIAVGALPERTALFIARCSFAVALLAGALVGQGMLLLVSALLLLGHAYSAPGLALKNRTSAAMAVVLVSGILTYCAGPVALGATGRLTDLIVLSVAMSLWMALVGAVAKDLSDIAGDAAVGRRTWAVTLGEKRTRALIAAGALAVGCGFAAATALWAPDLAPAAVVVLVGGAGVAVVTLGQRPGASRAVRRRPYRMFMVTQHLAHVSLLGQTAF
ncbi:UbiA family prenyltransferase [Streptomyces sp. ISL-98]|uniref:UbiA family prenyltransferase n=1 Tax=Streptomyces sp. ISL-98 TaxID=2819192 RepID=UPI001BE66D29|nr:UbiA family prenyltransferase [Streptomyces sp. ISL-98]MBT2510099.1 UbiA family prenyltransferase [Streptomyces sp. ISL-98]